MPTLLTFGFHDRESPRYYTVRKHYEGQGFTIEECHTEARGFFKKCRDLLRQFREKAKGCDAVLVTFPGHHLVWLAWLMTRLRPSGFAGQARWPRKKLIFDAFVSAYDTLVVDRKKMSKLNPLAWFTWLTDFLDCHFADEVLIDTEAHKKYFCEMFHLKPTKVSVIYLEAPPIFAPTRNAERGTRNDFHVLFYGSYIPLQGIDVILQAAAILQSDHPDIRFTLVGGGQTYKEMRALAEELKLTNVTFKPFAPLQELPRIIAEADVCLGIFGTGGKTQRVIPHKVVECLACGATVITADTPAIHERYEEKEKIHLVPAGDPKALAEKIKWVGSARHGG